MQRGLQQAQETAKSGFFPQGDATDIKDKSDIGRDENRSG